MEEAVEVELLMTAIIIAMAQEHPAKETPAALGELTIIPAAEEAERELMVLLQPVANRAMEVQDWRIPFLAPRFIMQAAAAAVLCSMEAMEEQAAEEMEQ